MFGTILFGAIFIIAGAFLVLTQIYQPLLFKEILRLWPLVLTAMGIVRLIKYRESDKKVNLFLFFSGIILTALSLTGKVDNLFVLAWGAVLIILGLVMLIQRKNNKGVTNHETIDEKSEYNFEFDHDPEEFHAKWEEMTKDAKWDFDEARPEPPTEDPQPQRKEPHGKMPEDDPGMDEKKRRKNYGIYENTIQYTNVKQEKRKGFHVQSENILRDDYLFSAQKKIYQSNRFNGGRISSVFSEVWLDLSKVVPQSDVLTINISVIFSSVRIRVPNNWVIYMSGNTIFGETTIPENPAVSPKYKLYISNNVTFGSLQIEYKEI